MVLIRMHSDDAAGIMFGYASDETKSTMPLTHYLATRLGKVLTEERKSGHSICSSVFPRSLRLHP